MDFVDEQYILDHFDEALKNGYIKAYYQPVVRTLTGQICSAEALARWEDPDLGLLSPLAFIGVLEKHKLIHKLDLAILENICLTYQKLKAKGEPIHPFSINLSRLDFAIDDMVEQISNTIEKYGVSADMLHIEITESVMLDNTDVFDKIFDQFHDNGFDIWMDDFGSGYSSLNVLKDYKFDILKIDMKFLSDFSSRSKKIIASIVNMSKLLGTHTLAEGVEKPEQIQFFKDIGCEMLQGYYYAKPMSEAVYMEYLQNNESKIEDCHEGKYWNCIGQLNFLSSNPLDEFKYLISISDTDDFSMFNSHIPLALIEYSDGTAHFSYLNKAYKHQIHRIGFADAESLEQAFNRKTSTQYLLFKNHLEKTIKTDKSQKMNYVTNDVYYTFRAKCIAKSQDRYMIAALLYTIDPDTEEHHATEFMKYGHSLFATYELVNIIHPDKDRAVQIYSNAGFDKIYGTDSLRQGIREFSEKQVHPDDRKRYLKFFDIDSIEERTDNSDRKFIQQPFRIIDPEKGYVWKNIRISKIPSSSESSYMYTIQTIASDTSLLAETILSEHPELFEL